MATKWGILSAGKISHDFVSSFAALDSNEHQIVAVAARTLESAQKFATEHGIPKAYGSYEELVKDGSVEVVYIGAINPLHHTLSLLALKSGKHVLCEKPLCVNVRETKEVLEFAEKSKLFFMEAVWSRFLPSYQRLREELNANVIGDVRQVLATFGVPIQSVDRIKLKELGGGTILDIGIYCVQFACFVFNGEKPLKVIAGGHKNEHGVDESVSVTLIYSGGKTATFATHSQVLLPNEALAIGTKGTLKLQNPFWCSTVLESPSSPNCMQHCPLPEVEKTFNFSNSVGLSFQCKEVRRCIQNGLTQSPIVSHQDTVLFAEIMESVRKQLGVVYPQDE